MTRARRSPRPVPPVGLLTAHGLCFGATILIAVGGADARSPSGDAQPADAATRDTGAETPTLERPKFSWLRYKEDWSVLADAPPEALTDRWDSIKYVPLSDDGSIWASFGGSMQSRLEAWSNFNFGTGADTNDEFLLFRALLHADVHIGENMRAFVEGKTAQSTSRDLPGGRRTLDADSLDLQQGFIEFKIPVGDSIVMTLRPGRQEFLFGKQRLVSPLPWANTLRTWDGVSAIVNWDSWTIHGFWSQFAPVQKYSFNDPDAQIQFYGVYATSKAALGPVGLDLYFLGLEKDDPVTFNGTTGTEDRYTLGGRLFGKCGDSGFDYDFEGAYQFGEVGSGDVSAFMIGSQVGYTPADMAWSPRFFAGFDYGSGDESAGGDVETFNQLFPLGHAYLGIMDVIGRQNVAAASLGVSCSPMKKLKLAVTGYAFWRADDSDALYNVGGGVTRGGGLGSSSEIGQEIDVVLTYTFDRHTKGQLGYGHFFAGDFIDQSGTASDIDFFYTQLQYSF